jgi:RNA polymerase sigma-70 factor (ECF subfamily)
MRNRRNGEFEQFFFSTKDQIFRVLLVVARDRDVAEDAASEGYVRALANWDMVERHPAPAAWVAKTALNYLRSRQRLMPKTSSDDVPEVPVSDEPPTDPELMRCLLALPQRQREVVALRVVLGLDTRQTAELIGVAEGTVTSHLFRALSRLQEDVSQIAPREAWL